MWFDNTRNQATKRRPNGSKETKAALVKEQCRLDMRKYSFSHEWTKLPHDCVNASNVNMLKI